ncbi:ABC transporter ATP-binding protein, partial [Rhizobium johnstonii]
DVVLTGITGTIETPLRWEADRQQVEHAERLLDGLGLAGKADARWPTLSQGERGRTLIARALIS